LVDISDLRASDQAALRAFSRTLLGHDAVQKTGYWLLRLSSSPKDLRTRMKWIPTISLPTLLGKVTLCMKRLNAQQWAAARGGGLCVEVSL
jgi:hypothetical protein